MFLNDLFESHMPKSAVVWQKRGDKITKKVAIRKPNAGDRPVIALKDNHDGKDQ